MKKYSVDAMVVILVLGLLSGCAAWKLPPITPEEQARLDEFAREEQTYLAKAMPFPLEFTIPKGEADEAWGRAQSFIGRYSSMKLQIATDFIIQTYNPGSLSGFGYYVTKTPMGDNVQITVQGLTDIYLASANQNAHILAYYIKTGELINPGLIKQ